MGSVHQSIPAKLADGLRLKYGLSVFVESGLGQGTSSLWAETVFETCISIELDANMIDQFKRAHPRSRVQIICGDSGVEINKIIVGLEPALFWLDGHSDDYTPIMTELVAINTSELGHVIMVDDLRLFGNLPAWPSLKQLRDLAGRRGRILREVDDVLIAVPGNANGVHKH